ncbi:hypothetical protein RF11_04810 [Thelohanellus kitauei]|uniref:Uncharacterized protein n=1 Tax=Thelohanellus kitauei TaxID=669202 RepID=A0A0C2LZY3_THEKT|nr:hypothetical protein RF11_04810 [Thelohanellus kitauei]
MVKYAMNQIGEVRDPRIQNNIILLTIKEVKNDYTSIWLSEINDFYFTKISTHLIGIDTEKVMTSIITLSIDYYIHVTDTLPGVIYISESILSRRNEIKKRSYISYNYENTFLQMKYRRNDGYGEWVNMGPNTSLIIGFIYPQKPTQHQFQFKPQVLIHC